MHVCSLNVELIFVIFVYCSHKIHEFMVFPCTNNDDCCSVFVHFESLTVSDFEKW